MKAYFQKTQKLKLAMAQQQKTDSKHAMAALASQFANFKDGYYFPDDDIDPAKKDANWHLAWNQAIWSLFLRGNAYNNIATYEQLQLLRLYGALPYLPSAGLDLTECKPNKR